MDLYQDYILIYDRLSGYIFWTTQERINRAFKEFQEFTEKVKQRNIEYHLKRPFFQALWETFGRG